MDKIKRLFAISKELLFQRVLTAKILRTMKITAIFLLTAFCLHAGVGGHSQTITLHARNQPILKVFEEIQKQTGYGFVYRAELLQLAKPVDLSVSQASLKTVLDLCFMDQPLDYSIVEKTVIVNKKEINQVGAAIAETLINVQGRLVNEKGEPLPGASIRVKGTSQGTSTDDNGDFNLKKVNADATIIISGINIVTLEIAVESRSDLGVITINKSVKESDQVVITGYGNIRKERFVGSFSQLGNDAYERRAGADIITRLNASVTGLLFNTKFPGEPVAQLQVHGLSTINSGTVPLIVVDNFPYYNSLSTINPNDVESITVLKDAAATSIWGARAGNGVIVISTKKARYNQPLSITVSSNISVTPKPDLFYYPQMSVSDFVDLETEFFHRGYYDSRIANTSDWPWITPVVDILNKRRIGSISSADSAVQIEALKHIDIRNDLDKYVYRAAINQQNYLSLGGASKNLTYLFSAGYNQDLKNIQHSRPIKYITTRADMSARPTKNLEVSAALSFTNNTDQSTQESVPIGRPYLSLADAEGHSLPFLSSYRNGFTDTAGAGQLLDWKYRPLDEIKLSDFRSVTKVFNTVIGAKYQILPFLKANVIYQFNSQQQNDEKYASVETFEARDLINKFTNLSTSDPALRHPVPIGGIMKTAQRRRKMQIIRASLDLAKTFSQHSITGQVVGELSEATYNEAGNTVYGYDPITGNNAGPLDYKIRYPRYGGSSFISIPSPPLYVSGTNDRLASFMANASYVFKNRYTLYGSARKDGSNVFGVNTNRKWKPLWSTGASWSITEENFFKVKWIQELRLRMSYGFSGNFAKVSGLPTILYEEYPASITNVIYASPLNPPNPDLRWETVKNINAGLDFSLFHNRLSGKLDVFQKNSSDLINTRYISPTIGFSDVQGNTASLRGRGFDFNLEAKVIDRKFKWIVSSGLSHVKTVVTKYNINSSEQMDAFDEGGINPRVGRIAYGLVSYRWAGLDPATGAPRGYLNKQISTDYNAIVTDSVDNQVFHGSSIPLYFGFLQNNFSFKNFRVVFNFSYKLDYYYRKPAINYFQMIEGASSYEYAQRWKNPGDERFTNVPSLPNFPDEFREFFYQRSEINVLRGDHLRLQDFSVSYTLNAHTNKKKQSFKSIQLSVFVNNLNVMIWKKDKSIYDPDYNIDAQFGNYPPIKTINARISVTL